ncbi:hypothetical protein DFJ74DRAFT_661709 [Hyaloraphidium curvatum]|nr:hypothetical protein DFJ74DRAFT_661709 [Hyaloraphidium curvatum]
MFWSCHGRENCDRRLGASSIPHRIVPSQTDRVPEPRFRPPAGRRASVMFRERGPAASGAAAALLGLLAALFSAAVRVGPPPPPVVRRPVPPDTSPRVATASPDIVDMRGRVVVPLRHGAWDPEKCDLPHTKVDAGCPRFVALELMHAMGLGHLVAEIAAGIAAAHFFNATFAIAANQKWGSNHGDYSDWFPAFSRIYLGETTLEEVREKCKPKEIRPKVWSDMRLHSRECKAIFVLPNLGGDLYGGRPGYVTWQTRTRRRSPPRPSGASSAARSGSRPTSSFRAGTPSSTSSRTCAWATSTRGTTTRTTSAGSTGRWRTSSRGFPPT